MAGWRILPVVCALAGCESVWNLDDVYKCPPTGDEDCDALIDAEDPCPADYGTDADADGDRIGDACDPNTQVARDVLLEFEAFDTKDPRWMSRGMATWDVHDSTLALDAGAVERTVSPNSQPTVEVVVAPAFSEAATVGVYVYSSTATTIPLECRIEHHSAGDYLVMLVGDPDMSTPAEMGRASMAGSATEGLRIYGGQITSFEVVCSARYGDHAAVSVLWKFFTTPADFDRIGFRVTPGAAARYESVTIFTTVP